MRFRLRQRSDVCLGPLQVELPQYYEIGEAVIDIRHRVLPICARALQSFRSISTCALADEGDDGASTAPAWETPVLEIPLKRLSESPRNGPQMCTTAYVAISFILGMDPEVLSHEVDDMDRPLVDRLVEPIVTWLQAPVGCLPCSCDQFTTEFNRRCLCSPRRQLEPCMREASCSSPWATTKSEEMQSSASVSVAGSSSSHLAAKQSASVKPPSRISTASVNAPPMPPAMGWGSGWQKPMQAPCTVPLGVQSHHGMQFV